VTLPSEAVAGLPAADRRSDVVRAAAIALLAVGLRLILFLAGSRDPTRFVQQDSHAYLELGKHFSASYLHTTGAFFFQSIVRTPGYPALLSAVYALGGGMHAMIAVQIALSGLTVLAVYYATLALAGAGAAMIASLLLALDVPSIVFADYVMTETLFALVVVLGTACALRVRPDGTRRWAVLAGLAFGVATLIRPITLYLPIVLLLLLLAALRAPARMRITLALLGVAAFAVPVGGWIVRNAAADSYVGLSPIDSINLLDYRAAAALGAADGISLPAARRSLHRRLRAEGYGDLTAPTLPAKDIPRTASAEQSLALHTLVHHPFGAFVMFGKGLRSLLLESAKGQIPQNLDRGRTGERLVGPVGAVDYLVTALAYIGTALSLLAIRRGNGRVAVPLAVALYVIVISAGPEAYARFRVPLMPQLAICAGVGFASWWQGRRTAALVRSRE
jgi:4-amino-4-deoxy-L-arabinose transferase-like glycosyltransferase